MRTILPILTLSTALAACGLLPSWIEIGDEHRGYREKIVAGREEPSTFVAADRTICPVDKEKFQRVKVGDALWCYWRSRGYATPDIPAERIDVGARTGR